MVSSLEDVSKIVEDNSRLASLNQKSISYICHPYTARKDIGAGADRYAYELIRKVKPFMGSVRIYEADIVRSLPKAIIAEAAFQAKMLRERSDLFHAVASVSASSLLRQKKRPVVTTIHDIIPFLVSDKNDAKWKFAYKRHCIRQAIKKSDLVIVPFKSTFDFLINELKTDENKLRLVNYGVDHSQFFPGEKPVNQVKKVLFVGAVNKGKGIDSLVKSWDLVINEFPDTELLIASKGWDTEYIISLIEKCRHKNKIRRLGFIPERDLREAYLNADISIFPSRYGFGLSTLESMACGTPTISGRTLDAPEFVGDAGLLVNPDDLNDIAEKILLLLKDEDLYQELILKGINKARIYTWENSAVNTLKVYSDLIL